MGVFDLIKLRKKKEETSKRVRIFTFGDFEPESINELQEIQDKDKKRKAKLPTWYTQSPYGHPRQDDITTLRQLAQMGIVQRCINVILDQVLMADWDIIPTDPEDESPSTQQLIKAVKDFLLNVNSNETSFFIELRKALTDLFEIGEGVIVKVFDQKAYTNVEGQFIVPSTTGPGLLRELQAYDASQFYVFVDYTGRILGHWQFNFVNTSPQFFTPRELILFQNEPTTYRLYGRSRVAQVKEFLEMVFYQMLQMKRYYEKGAIFQGFLKTTGLNETEQKKIEKFITEKFRSMKHKFGIFHGGKDTEIDFVPLMLSIQDLAFLDGLDFVQRFVMSVFGVTPNELGITDTVNRATAAEQGNVFRRRTVRTLMNMIEYRVNKEIIKEFDPEGRIEFKFIEEIDPQAKQLEQNIAASQIDRMQITINEWRQQNGLDPVEWGDVPYRILLMQQRQQFQGQSQQNQNPEKYNEDTSEEQTQENQREDGTKKKEAVRFGPGESVEKYGLNTSDFFEKSLPGDIDKKLYRILDALSSNLFKSLKKVFSLWRARVLQIEPSRQVDVTTQEIRGALNIDELANEITSSMMEAYEKGLQLDDNMTINENIFGLQDTRTLEYFRQYPLLLAENIENRVERTLRYEIMEGVARGESIPKIRKRIQSVFDNLEDWEADRIARTEVTNATTWGRINQLRSHNHSRWVFYATEDERTCPICREHHLKVYDINDLEFKPPLHPNCRCTVLSTESFEEGELDFSSAKSISTTTSRIPSKKQAEIELREGESIVKVLTQKYNHEGKSTREIAEEIGVTHQTVAKWIKQYGITKSNNNKDNDDGRWVTINGKHVFIRFKSHTGKFISAVKLDPDDIHAFEAESPGIPGVKVKQFSLPFKVSMTKKSFDDHKLREGHEHFKSYKEYLAVLNDPEFIRAQKTRRGPKAYVFGRRSEGENLAVVIVFSREDQNHKIATGFVLTDVKRTEYEAVGELIYQQEENPQK